MRESILRQKVTMLLKREPRLSREEALMKVLNAEVKRCVSSS